MKLIFNVAKAGAVDNYFLGSVGFFGGVTVRVYSLCVCRCLAYSKECFKNSWLHSRTLILLS